MQTMDVQFVYMVLVLPSLFGLTLVGEGVGKLAHHRMEGWVSMTAGIGFIGLVVGAYFVLTGVV